MSEKPLALAIMGPTACGKSSLSLALAEHLQTEVISVDSAAVFRGLDIGSAKPSAEELARVPHHLVDLCDPVQSYSAADFCRDARAVIESLTEKSKPPLLVGGTMLYFKALLEGLSDMPATDAATRAEVESEAKEKGWPAMHAQLMAVDPEYAGTLHPNHSQRIGRALEVYRISGVTMSQWRQRKGPALRDKFSWLQICLIPRERSWLHQRIERRFDEMLELGLVDEVKALYARGDLHAQLPAIRAVGYRQIWAYLSGEVNYSEMRQKGIAATRQLAKRQMTWLRSWPDLQQLWTQDDAGNTLNSSQIVNDALNFLPKRTI